MVKIRKRDGRIKPYSPERIKNALYSAFEEVSSKECYLANIGILMKLIEEGISSHKEDIVDIEVIQELCIMALKEVGLSNVAESFDEYRKQRERVRSGASSLYKSVLKIVEGTNEEVGRENSNKDGTILSTQRDLIAGEISKEIAMNFLIDEEVAKAHREGVLHYHDADYAMQKGMFNCCLINIQDMLDNGTVINEKMVESPKSFETACTVVTQIIAGISSCQHGGNSITIRHLAPYLRKTYEKEYDYFIKTYGNEELAKKEALNRRAKALKDGVQTIRYQLSTLQTTNGQIGCLC